LTFRSPTPSRGRFLPVSLHLGFVVSARRAVPRAPPWPSAIRGEAGSTSGSISGSTSGSGSGSAGRLNCGILFLQVESSGQEQRSVFEHSRLVERQRRDRLPGHQQHNIELHLDSRAGAPKVCHPKSEARRYGVLAQRNPSLR
jgi:hypothetical protein